MEIYTDAHGVECHHGATEETPFTADLFHRAKFSQGEEQACYAFHSELGRLTVLERVTGYGWRDVESGFRDPDGAFWLASGSCDVRRSDCKTIGEAIAWVKKSANTCVGA